MNYLKDSCVFINHTNDDGKIIGIALWCKKNNSKVTISKHILDELYPGSSLESDVKLKAISLHECIDGAVSKGIIDMIDIKSNRDILDTYNEIRTRFYKWMREPSYLKMLVDRGDLTQEEIKSAAFRHKDEGECSLIAIAMNKPKNYAIITEDKGRVYKHPFNNLFDTYAEPHGIQVMNYKEWINYIEYSG